MRQYSIRYNVIEWISQSYKIKIEVKPDEKKYIILLYRLIVK